MDLFSEYDAALFQVGLWGFQDFQGFISYKLKEKKVAADWWV